MTDAFGQENIIDARHRPPGSVITVKGVILNGSELGVIRYLQDSTAGIAAYPGGAVPPGFEQTTTGDEISITGVLSVYHGLLEINPILSFQKLGSGQTLPEPLEKDPGQLTDDDQGRLVRINCTQFQSAPGHFDSGNHPVFTSKGTRTSVYIEGNHPLTGDPLPEGSVDLIVIASYFDEVRLLVRSSADMMSADCFHIVPTPRQSMIGQESFNVSWTSSMPGEGFSIVRDEADVEQTIATPLVASNHILQLTDLTPAVFYQVQVGAVNTLGDTAMYPPIPMTTKSTSSGNIAIYFNQGINPAFSNGSQPDGTTFDEMMTSIFDLIDNALSTIDVAMYNSNRPDIITRLEQAMQRGVRVRYIGDGGQSNSALDPLPDFPVMFRNGDGIMHHKFIIVDPHDPALATVWTGSTNHSTGQLSTDPNNAIVIEDRSLAKAYLHEFEEMWGGSGNSPNPLLSRTGSAKRDDTPHLFQIGDRVVESYFSPSDHTNQEILNELITAEESINVGLLLLTRNDLTNTMIDRAQAGIRVRVIIDDEESSEFPIQALIEGGVAVAHHDYNAIFHHKYAMIDEGTLEARVITGSHNWTTSATVRNDENTLILHDPDITNIYRQEFEARWAELVPTSIKTEPSSNVRITPNPTANLMLIQTEETISSVTIRTIMGDVVYAERTDDPQILIGHLPAGVYVATVQLTNGAMVNVPVVKL